MPRILSQGGLQLCGAIVTLTVRLATPFARVLPLCRQVRVLDLPALLYWYLGFYWYCCASPITAVAYHLA